MSVPLRDGTRRVTPQRRSPAPRRVTLVLCTADARVLGALPPFDVPLPWWSDAGEVVAGARVAHGVEVVVLRALSLPGGAFPGGGPVTYLAQVDREPDVALTPWPGDPLAAHPLRAGYARPGGPQADVAWACGLLDARGVRRTGPPEQVRTWNLSSIWRLPTAAGPAWLKVVPPFSAHEGPLLERLDTAFVPALLGRSGGRLLLADVPGSDRYGATGAELETMVRMLVRLQLDWTGRTDELLGSGVPDWRVEAFAPRAQALTAGAPARAPAGGAAALGPDELRALDQLVGSLPERFAAVAGCGIPDGLFHGDFHPGNVRGTDGRLVLLDWGDSGVGHPLLDQSAFCERLSAADRARVLATWRRLWRDAVPGCDPDHAARLLAPVAALRAAVVYRQFLDSIEPDERPYHAHDPLIWLRRAAELAVLR